MANRTADDLAIRLNSGDLCDPFDPSAIIMNVVAVTVSIAVPDLAELTLQRDVEGISLPSVRSVHDIESQTVWAAGWGSRSNGNDFVCDLKVVALKVVPAKVCAAIMSGLTDSAAERVFCAVGAGVANTCAGDSGSPVFMRDGKVVSAVGLVLGGSGCGPDDPGMYLDLTRQSLVQQPP